MAASHVITEDELGAVCKTVLSPVLAVSVSLGQDLVLCKFQWPRQVICYTASLLTITYNTSMLKFIRKE